MIRKTLTTLTLALTMMLFLAPIAGTSALALDYCADMMITSEGRPAAPVMKTCTKGTKIRHEIKQGGMQMIIIYRPDKKITWTLMPMMKSYMEMPYNEQEVENSPQNWREDYSALKKNAKLMGTETVNGVVCEKFVMGKQGQELIYWVSKKDKLPIRIVSGTTTIDYKNIHTGDIPDSLFEIPAGYNKMNLPVMPTGGMPGAGGGMPGMTPPAGRQ